MYHPPQLRRMIELTFQVVLVAWLVRGAAGAPIAEIESSCAYQKAHGLVVTVLAVYVSHVLTIKVEPGAGKLETASAYTLGMLLPIATCRTACLDLQTRIWRHKRPKTSDDALKSLQRAIDCGACCMDVDKPIAPPRHARANSYPPSRHNPSSSPQIDWSGVTFEEVGYGTLVTGGKCDDNQRRVLVPRGTDARLFFPQTIHGESTTVSAVAGLGQLLVGSFQLALVGTTQIKTLGTGAYVFTIIPYMSATLVNVTDAVVNSKYPSKTLLRPKPTRERRNDFEVGPVGRPPFFQFAVMVLTMIAWVLTVQISAGGDRGSATTTQHTLLYLWPIFGMVSTIIYIPRGQEAGVLEFPSRPRVVLCSRN